MKVIFKKWKKNYKRIVIIFLGMVLGILAISIGLSFFEDAINFSKELSNGDNKVSEVLMYKSNDKPENIFNNLKKVSKYLNKDYKVSIGSVTYPIDRKASLSDAPSIIPVLYNKDAKWKPNLIYGRYLTMEETLSDKKITVIGYEIYKKVFQNKDFNNKIKINIYGQDYEVIGVVGRTKRYCPQNFQIEVPYKNYFSFYMEEPDINNIPLLISGNKEFNISDIKYKNLSLIDKPKYINNINIPLKLVVIVGILLLLTTIINESNLFSLWIISCKKQIAIKKALGATNFIIIIDIFKETLLISCISAIISLIIQYIIQINLNNILYNYELRVTFLNFSIAIITSVVMAIFTSLIPARIILAINPSDELKR